MEATNRTTGNSDAKHGEDRQPLRVMRHKGSIRQFRHPSLLCIDAPTDSNRHQQQGKSKYGINPANEFVDGQQCGEDEVKEDERQPETV